VPRAWFEFAACLAVIGYAGYQLTRYADAMAEKLRLSSSWAGLVLLASVTSLPELMAGASAATVAAAPDIAVGDVIGSSVFNLFLLALSDLLLRRGSLYAHASRGRIVSAAAGIVLLAIVMVGTLFVALVTATHGARRRPHGRVQAGRDTTRQWIVSTCRSTVSVSGASLPSTTTVTLGSISSDCM
jgi:Ca2+/Na+ antiporter